MRLADYDLEFVDKDITSWGGISLLFKLLSRCHFSEAFLMAFVADIRMIANYWLRPGNTGATTNFLSFLENTLERLHNKKVGLIRMDSGFYSVTS